MTNMNMSISLGYDIPATRHSSLATSSVRDYLALLKPGVMSLVVFTGLVGMLLAPGHLHPFLQLVTLLCIALGSGAGGALNMWYDRDIDAMMARTASRPLPAGRIQPGDALAFGMVLAVASVTLLGLATNPLAATLLAFAIFFYAVIYTAWLKRRTPQNIVIGGLAGAMPPLIGWTAVTGGIAWLPLVLVLIIFLWTPPHFWALALYRNSDYAKAGIPMLPVIAGPSATKWQMLAYTVLLVAVSLLPVAAGALGPVYAAASALLGILFLRHALLVLCDASSRAAPRMFGFSIFYLFLLFAFMMFDHWLRGAGA